MTADEMAEKVAFMVSEALARYAERPDAQVILESWVAGELVIVVGRAGLEFRVVPPEARPSLTDLGGGN